MSEGTSLQKFAEAGRATDARRKEIHGMVRSLQDRDQWGKHQGRNLSEGSLYALARMCHVTKADPSGLRINTVGLPTGTGPAMSSNDSTPCGWTGCPEWRNAGGSSLRWTGKAC